MKLSLGRKMVLSITLIAMILSVTCIGVSSVVFHKIMDREYLITADSMADTVAVTIDGDRVQRITEKVMELYNASENKLTNEQWEDPNFEAYISQYFSLMEDEDYIAIREQLRRVQDVSEIDCAYTVYGNAEDMTMIYIVDGAYEDIVPIGSFDMAEKEYYPYLNNPEQGIPAVITSTPEYGHLVTSCAPIRNSEGEIVCFAAVDLSMNDVI